VDADEKNNVDRRFVEAVTMTPEELEDSPGTASSDQAVTSPTPGGGDR